MRATKTATITIAALALILVAPVAAQNFSGNWQLQTETTLDGEETPCVYQGTVPVDAVEGEWNGPAELSLVSGPAACPAEMIGDMTGFIEQDGGVSFITGFIDGADPSGFATFDGVISPNPGGSGTFAVNEGQDGGPFAGESGIWAAELLAQSVLEIPVLGSFGLAALTALLLISGGWILARSQMS